MSSGQERRGADEGGKRSSDGQDRTKCTGWKYNASEESEEEKESNPDTRPPNVPNAEEELSVPLSGGSDTMGSIDEGETDDGKLSEMSQSLEIGSRDDSEVRAEDLARANVHSDWGNTAQNGML